MNSRSILCVLAPIAALAVLAPVHRAHACGGTFCDNLPQPMPVDQRGEDILFVMDGTTVEVHVRIEYTGAAERFAWVLPLQGVPEVSVGSDPLFTAMSSAVGPRWTTTTEFECDDPWDDDDGGVKLDLASDDPSPPAVVFQEVVGAFEVVVLQGGSAAEVVEFLAQNDYAQDPAATPILQEYLDEGFLFAAVKLAAGAEVDEIHPLAFRFAGDEPCVPIRLTRIAAEEDMGIRAYFLGQDRWAPINYDHVVLNPLAYDWQTPGDQRYLELLTLAVDEAGGHAFVTEYAGPTDVVPELDIYRPSWDETAFLGVDPIAAIELIDVQGLSTHPLIRALLMEFIPPPPGVSPPQFWNDIVAYADQIDLDAWDDVAFAAALVERIIDPGLHAVDLLETWPKLTRLHTTMSPAEMTYDPMFVANADLPDVDRARVTTIREQLCSDDRVFHVELDGADTPVCVPAGTSYPSWTEMPLALRVEQIPLMGPPQVVLDNSEAILAAHHSQQAGVECIADGGNGDGGGDGSGGGDEAADDESGGPTYDLPYDLRCGCATERGEAPVAVGLALLVLGLLRPRRRR
jgi:MYXO-CTERM domain-containing protein